MPSAIDLALGRREISFGRVGINKRSYLFPVLEEASDSRSYLKIVK